MTTSINEHTRDVMQSKPSTKAYEENWGRIFRKAICPSCGKEVDKNAYDTVEYDGAFWHEGCFEWEAVNLGNIGVGVKDSDKEE